MHLLDKGPGDDFYDADSKNIDRFTSFLNFLVENRGDFYLIQLGDMLELWQARRNRNLLYQAYPNSLDLTDDELKPTYVAGNHDLDISEW